MIVTQNGTITDPTVHGGGVVAAGAFTAKGQPFPAGGVISGGTFDVGATEMVSAASAYGGHFKGTQLLLNGATASGGLFEAGGQQIIGGYYLSAVDSSVGQQPRSPMFRGRKAVGRQILLLPQVQVFKVAEQPTFCMAARQ